MATLTGSRSARTLTLCVLYAAQGMPWGFVTIALLSYLAGQGAGLEETAKITSLATLPWTFKVFWGPVIDRFTLRSMGRRRPWILFAQLAMSATLLAMILIGDLTAEFETLAWMVFLHNCFVSLQDVASDALAVDVLLEDERGSVNGMMWASSYVGTAIGGAGMGTVIANYGLRPAFCLQAGVLFLILCVPLYFRERAGEKLFPWSEGEAQRAPGEEDNEDIAKLVRGLFGAFAAKAPSLGAIFAYSLSIMVGMRVAVMPVFYIQELRWTDEHYSQVEGGAGSVAGVLGALIGGFLVDRLGVKAIVTVAVLGVAAFCVAMGVSEELRVDESFLSLFGMSFSFPLIFMLGTTFLISMKAVASFSLFMRLCTPAVAGTQYTLYMAISNLARVSGAAIVGWLESDGCRMALAKLERDFDSAIFAWLESDIYRVIFLVMAGAIVLPLVFLYQIKDESRAAKA